MVVGHLPGAPYRSTPWTVFKAEKCSARRTLLIHILHPRPRHMLLQSTSQEFLASATGKSLTRNLAATFFGLTPSFPTPAFFLYIPGRFTLIRLLL